MAAWRVPEPQAASRAGGARRARAGLRAGAGVHRRLLGPAHPPPAGGPRHAHRPAPPVPRSERRSGPAAVPGVLLLGHLLHGTGRLRHAARVAGRRRGRELPGPDRAVRLHPQRHPLLLHVAQPAAVLHAALSPRALCQGPPPRPRRGGLPAANDGRGVREHEICWLGEKHPHERRKYRGLSRYHDINYSHFLASCESGWDHSTRCDGDRPGTESGRWLDFLPVCLNSMLYARELDLEWSFDRLGDGDRARYWETMAAERAEVMRDAVLGPRARVLLDFEWKTEERSTCLVPRRLLSALGRVGDAANRPRRWWRGGCRSFCCRADWSRRSNRFPGGSGRTPTAGRRCSGSWPADSTATAITPRRQRSVSGGATPARAASRRAGRCSEKYNVAEPGRQARERLLRPDRGLRLDQRGVRGFRTSPRPIPRRGGARRLTRSSDCSLSRAFSRGRLLKGDRLCSLHSGRAVLSLAGGGRRSPASAGCRTGPPFEWPIPGTTSRSKSLSAFDERIHDSHRRFRRDVGVLLADDQEQFARQVASRCPHSSWPRSAGRPGSPSTARSNWPCPCDCRGSRTRPPRPCRSRRGRAARPCAFCPPAEVP